jgi:hypothetical protein
VSTRTAGLDETLKTRAMTLLFAQATTAHEMNSLTRVALRAGFLWRCHPCKEDHFLAATRCACGAKRPAHLG